VLLLEEPTSDSVLNLFPLQLYSLRCFRGGQTADQKRSCSHSAVAAQCFVLFTKHRFSSPCSGSPVGGSLILSRSASPPVPLIVSRRLSGWLLLWTRFPLRPSGRGWVRSGRHTLWGVVWVFRFLLWVWWVRRLVRCSCPRRVSRWSWYGVFLLGKFIVHYFIVQLFYPKSLLVPNYLWWRVCPSSYFIKKWLKASLPTTAVSVYCFKSKALWLSPTVSSATKRPLKAVHSPLCFQIQLQLNVSKLSRSKLKELMSVLSALWLQWALNPQIL